MPDHIHLLIKIKNVEKRKSLPVLVWQLCRALSAEYSRIADGYGYLPQNPAASGQVLRLPTASGQVLRLSASAPAAPESAPL